MTQSNGLPVEAQSIASIRTWTPRADEKSEKPRFRLIPFCKIKVSTAAAYLVRNIIPRVGLTIVYGPPKSGKSFWAFDLLMHVALGWQYRGRRVKWGAVVYVVMEGATGFLARVEAFRRVNLPDDAGDQVPFFLISAPLALVNDHPALIAAIREELCDMSPAAIALDTVNRSLTGSESSDQDMSNYVRAADTVRDAFSCAVLLVHHSGLDTSRPRGHTALAGAADAQVSIKRNTADQIVATVEFMKDGAAGDEIVSAFRVIDVGEDEDGEMITSLVLDPVEGAAVAKAKTSKPPRLPDSAKVALDALKQAIDEAGVAPPASNHIPAGAKVVDVKLWRSYAYQRGISSGEARAKQKAFDSGMRTLTARNLVQVWDDQAWLGVAS